MSHMHRMSAAYALEALDGIERLSFESHLAECPECRSDVLDLKDASELLSVGVTLDPPASLKDRVMATTELAPGLLGKETPTDQLAESEPAKRKRWFGKSS